jgi:hypothetical protein
VRRVGFSIALFLTFIAQAEAEPSAWATIGTPEQRHEAVTACGRDVRLYCQSLSQSDGLVAYVACLERNRSRLSSRCVGLLARYGQ